MIEPKDIPKEFVSIRQVWLMQINRCLEAISNQELKDETTHSFAGDATVTNSIKALYYSLIDWGEAKVKTDVDRLFYEWRKSLQPNKKYRTSTVSMKQFEIIIQVLNKYGMLFESQPKGYSNVEMKSV